jgi:glutamyl-tRNA(Gln) amidotransferase subunit E
MKSSFDARQNYEDTRKAIGYVTRKEATQADYDRIGFMSGLEVHQQLLTRKKLFCHCPAGIYNDSDDYDAEIIRHMRPTLSELGEYDGTALMEFKTRKEIVYRIKHKTACTYEVDDTPPFPIDREALDIAIEISLLSKLNIVGEVHVTRKQYLDGSIPTGFQRTAIIGVEGEIKLKNKKVRLIQLSVEEDSCREISDIGHVRVYKTDRLGMPLIETVTYPDMTNPDEVMEACDYIRFLNRSIGKVRTGMGAGREDVNVSCRGGHRVEIKGVAHTKWIPELTHNEAFRQWALLNVREILKKKIKEREKWKIQYKEIDYSLFNFPSDEIKNAKEKGEKIYAVNLQGFLGILSHFTQPGKCFYDELSERLKVIACIEKPNMASSEDIDMQIAMDDTERITKILGAADEDAQVIFWGPEDDVATALETIEERCQMAFKGIPPETRKSFKNGSTIFERVLPGADRMYPDTDSAPIPLSDEHILNLGKNLPVDVVERFNQLREWDVPEDTYTYLLKRNLFPLLEKLVKELQLQTRFAGCFLGHTFKTIEGRMKAGKGFQTEQIFDMFQFLKSNGIDFAIARQILPHLFEHPKMDFESILTILNFKKIEKRDIISKIQYLKDKYEATRRSHEPRDKQNWIMGQLRKIAVGNINLKELADSLE